MSAISVQKLPSLRSRPLFWMISFVVAVMCADALSDAFSEITDYSRMGKFLPHWEPFVWEFSSTIMIGTLIPFLAWLIRRVPVLDMRWYRSVPIHLLATLPFSIIHVAGMVVLRKAAYALVGASYNFGPVLSSWWYEYRKDFVTYWITIAFLSAFAGWSYWRNSQLERRSGAPGQTDISTDKVGKLDRLVVHKLNREFILDVADIVRIESDGNYVTLHAHATTYHLRSSLSGLLKRLDECCFVQVHRCHVVNIYHIREIQPWNHGDYRIVISDGSMVNFSRRYRARLDTLLDSPDHAQQGHAVRP